MISTGELRKGVAIELDGETGVRIEDLVLFDARESRLDPLTRFPSGVVIVGT